MVEFFKSLSPVQWVMIAAGVVILFPYVKGIFVKSKPEDPEVDPDPELDIEKSSITCLVNRWDHLYQCCKKHDMKEVCDKLDEIFPMFVDAPRDCCKEISKSQCDKNCPCPANGYKWPFEE